MSLEEAACLCNAEGAGVKDEFWKALCEVNGIAATSFDSAQGLTVDEEDSNKQISSEEIEVLRAIFPEEEDLQVTSFIDSQNKCVTNLIIPLPPVADENRVMCLQYYEGSYPMKRPKAFVTGGWKITNPGYGTAIHSELLKFVVTLPQDEPMIFELFNYAQELLQSGEDSLTSGTIKSGHDSALLPYLKGGDVYAQKEAPATAKRYGSKQDQKTSRSKGQSSGPTFKRRPRTKSFFWSKSPKETPPAQAFPKLRTVIENARKRLPAAAARDEFLRVMKAAEKTGNVVLVTGETGCGKTTQIPQFILEEAPKDAKIVIAQPRRLAATGVADRVADERGEGQAGTGSVGYVVRGEVKMCNDTRLMFCTTGVLLRQLQSQGALDCVTHIVIDEVHERHLDTDILLAILKETRPPHLRVVLMSATMDADRFAAYWGNNTPRMHIPGYTHPVKDFALEDVLAITGYIPPKKGKKKNGSGNWNNNSKRKKTAWNDSELSDDEGNEGEDPEQTSKDSTTEPSPGSRVSSIPIEELVKRVTSNDIDYDMLAILVQHLVKTKERDDDGSILVFLPGAPEIGKAKDAILKIARGERMSILLLHGGLQAHEQKRVFDNAERGITKVILSTNVAGKS